MRKNLFRLACVVALALAFNLVAMADDPAKVGGSWEMTVEGQQGPITQTLTFTQDGSKIKGTIKGQRGESPFEGAITGNKVNFTVKRETPNGEMVIEYAATVDGDSMKGTSTSPRGTREWTAKREKAK